MELPAKQKKRLSKALSRHTLTDNVRLSYDKAYGLLLYLREWFMEKELYFYTPAIFPCFHLDGFEIKWPPHITIFVRPNSFTCYGRGFEPELEGNYNLGYIANWLNDQELKLMSFDPEAQLEKIA